MVQIWGVIHLEAPPGIGPGIKVLQTSALPLGYGAVFGTGILYHVGAGLSMLFAKIFFYFCEGREGGFTVVEQRQKEKPEAITSK